MEIRSLLQLLGMILVPFMVVIVPLLFGQWIGIKQKEKVPDLQRAPVGAISGAAFGLLAFLLAFTFNIAASRYDARKKLFLDEVTNIRTTYLRSEYLGEPYTTKIQKHLIEYVNLRLELVKDLSKLEYVMTGSGMILDSLWSETVKLSKTSFSPAIFSLFSTSVTNLVDNYNQRVTVTLEYRIPPLIYWALFLVTFFSMLTLGFQFGLSGRGNIRIFVLLAMIFSIVMFLILELDNSRLLRMNHQPLMTLQQQLMGHLK